MVVEAGNKEGVEAVAAGRAVVVEVVPAAFAAVGVGAVVVVVAPAGPKEKRTVFGASAFLSSSFFCSAEVDPAAPGRVKAGSLGWPVVVVWVEVSVKVGREAEGATVAWTGFDASPRAATVAAGFRPAGVASALAFLLASLRASIALTSACFLSH